MKLKTFFCILLTVASCTNHNNNTQNPKISLQYYKEGMELLKSYYQKKDSADTKVISQNIIDKFKNSYESDTSKPFALDKLIYLTYQFGDYNNCISWSEKSFIFTKDQRDSADINSQIGLCYVLLGDLDSASPFLDKALSYKDTDTLGNNKYTIKYAPWQTTLELDKISEEIISNSNHQLTATLRQKNIDPCIYSVRLLKFVCSRDTSTVYLKHLNDLRQNCR